MQGLVDCPEDGSLRVVQLAQSIVLRELSAPVSVRDRGAEKLLVLRIRHIFDVAGEVIRKALVLCGNLRAGALLVDTAGQADVLAGGSDLDAVVSLLNFPGVGPGVPVAEGVVIERDRNAPGLPCLQEDRYRARQPRRRQQSRCS